MEFATYAYVLGGGFVLAVVFGAVTQKTHFCTMGAVSDWVNIGDKARMGSWFCAIAVALAGVLLCESMGWVEFDATRPPYRSTDFAWARYIVGGLLFGIGMSLASGCPTKTLVRLGGGSLKAVCVLLMLGIFAYLMTKTDFYGIVFHSWLAPLTIDLDRYEWGGQDVGALLAVLSGAELADARLWSGGVVIAVIAIVLLFTADFRASREAWSSGLLVGLIVAGGWYLTGGPWGQEWLEAAEWLDQPPAGVAVQSYTFVNPLGEMLDFLFQSGAPHLITFGMLGAAGVVLGAAAMALLSGSWHLEWFASWGDFMRHMIGAALMGCGGVLAMGCTVGQGITGVSTLAVGSWLALISMILASATTMKIQYYKMLYEDASMLDAWLSGWADLCLLPASWRRLEAL